MTDKNEQRPHDWPYCHGAKPRVDATDSGSVDTAVLREILHDLCALWVGDNSEPKARLIAHIESLIAGVRKDAERLDFLEVLAERNEDSMPNIRAYGKTFMGETLRDAIDAALIHSPATSSKEGRRMRPGVDALYIAAGMHELVACGYPATEVERHAVVQYALQRWARGEEAAAQRGATNPAFHGIDLTSWIRVLAAARAATQPKEGGTA